MCLVCARDIHSETGGWTGAAPPAGSPARPRSVSAATLSPRNICFVFRGNVTSVVALLLLAQVSARPPLYQSPLYRDRTTVYSEIKGRREGRKKIVPFLDLYVPERMKEMGGKSESFC